MYECPACGDKNISFFRKWLAYPAVPAHCKQCDAYSLAHRNSGGVGIVVSALLLTLLGFCAAAIKSGWPLLIGGGAVACYYFWHWHQVQLELIPSEQVAEARKAEAAFGITWLLLIFLN
jgi:hypothetical protein